MTNKRKQRVRKIQEKTGMSYQAASNALALEPSAKEWLYSLRREAFPMTGPIRTVTLNPRLFQSFLKQGAGFFEPCTSRYLLSQGFFGSLFELDGYLGRSTPVYVSREVPDVEFDRPIKLKLSDSEEDIFDLVKDEFRGQLPDPMGCDEALGQLLDHLLGTEEGRTKIVEATISMLRSGKDLNARIASLIATVLEATRK
jgi:hypothetical protein